MKRNAMEGKGRRWKERKEDGRAAEHLLRQRSAKATASLLVSTAQMSPVDPPRPHVEYAAMSLYYKPFIINFLNVSDISPPFKTLQHPKEHPVLPPP